MAYKNYPKSEGVLFKNNDKTAENHPDMRGHIVLTREQINMLVKMDKAGLEMRLQTGCWFRKSKQGKKYFYLGTEAYMKEEEVHQDDPFPDEGPAKDEFEDDDVPF